MRKDWSRVHSAAQRKQLLWCIVSTALKRHTVSSVLTVVLGFPSTLTVGKKQLNFGTQERRESKNERSIDYGNSCILRWFCPRIGSRKV